MQGRNNLGGGADIKDVIKGIYEEYKVASGGNVCVGDFVNILTDYSKYENLKNTSIIPTSTSIVSATALSESCVFIAYSDTSNHLSGIVCNIINDNIIVGYATELDSTFNSGNYIAVTALGKTKVFIAHSSAGSVFLYGMICTINGTTITININSKLSLSNYRGYIESVVLLDTNKVAIIYYNSTGSGGSFANLWALVCTINGETITKGAETQLSVASSVLKVGTLVAITLDPSRIFLVYGAYGSYARLYSQIISVSGTTISKNTEYTLNSSNQTGNSISAMLLDEDVVFITHRNASPYNLYGMVCSTNGVVIEKGQDTLLKEECGYNTPSVIRLANTKILIVHSDGTNKLYCMSCDINNKSIIVKTDILLRNIENSGTNIFANLLNNKVFILHSRGSYFYGMILKYFENLVKTITSSTERIDGIAITDGQAGEMVQVKKPDEMLEITLNATIVAGGNSISWNNVKLSHRKVLDGSNKVYTTSKTLTINNIVYNFKLYLFYIKNNGWRIGCEFSPELYSTSTNPVTFFNWVHYLTNKIYTETYYTEANKTGTAVTFTADVTI